MIFVFVNKPFHLLLDRLQLDAILYRQPLVLNLVFKKRKKTGKYPQRKKYILNSV